MRILPALLRILPALTRILPWLKQDPPRVKEDSSTAKRILICFLGVLLEEFPMTILLETVFLLSYHYDILSLFMPPLKTNCGYMKTSGSVFQDKTTILSSVLAFWKTSYNAS
jgi:hypothetical protein